MASRFWAGGSSSDSDSDSSSGSSSSDDSAPVTTTKGPQRTWAIESDSDSEDEVRVVKSAKQKALEGMKAAATKIKNRLKVGDWSGVQTDFDELNKAVAKADRSTGPGDGAPAFYIKLLAELEDAVAAGLANKAAVKKMNGPNAKGLNRMKLVLRKHNKQYEDRIAAFRENPGGAEEEGGSASSSSSSSGLG
mmetsp:Transcript_474/g.659  ORF Transcript_474/g.659 Transcript_474/m.659 type:complete len:192 (-) Transcript_474:125-700(-)